MIFYGFDMGFHGDLMAFKCFQWNILRSSNVEHPTWSSISPRKNFGNRGLMRQKITRLMELMILQSNTGSVDPIFFGSKLRGFGNLGSSFSCRNLPTSSSCRSFSCQRIGILHFLAMISHVKSWILFGIVHWVHWHVMGLTDGTQMGESLFFLDG